MRLINKNKEIESLLISLAREWHQSERIIAFINGKSYTVYGIYISYKSYSDKNVELIKKVFGCKDIFYCDMVFENNSTYEVFFENVWNDYILVTFKRNEVNMTIFSERADVQKFYQDKIQEIKRSFETDMDTIRIPWRCYLEQEEVSNLEFYISLPKMYDKTIPLENYPDDTRAELIRLEHTLESGNYNGKIIVLEGPPGTGKSYFVRRIVSRLYQSKRVNRIYFYLGWGIRGLDITHCLDNNILIFEDADKILKIGDRSNDVARVLNLSSGFIETSALFLFTSNLEIGELDDAFIRDGRLLARIRFNPFNKKQAKEWLVLRGCEDELDQNEYTLANLYSKIKQFKKIENQTRLVPMGFR